MAGQRSRRLTKRRKGSPFYQCNFTVNGRRFRDSLKTDNPEEAEALADAIRRQALLGHLTGKLPEMTLTQACGRYLLEHAQHLPTADDIKRYSATLLEELGKHTLLSEIKSNKIAETVAKLRGRGLANGSVNRHTGHLRAVLIRARDTWEVAVAKVNWKRLFLEEPDNVQHILSADEEKRLFENLRPDLHGFVRFALISGQRLENVVTLTWRQIDWDAGMISFRVKSKKPGGELRYIPLTPALKAILSLERGRHPSRVFTYVCQRNRHDPKRKLRQVKGQRYPLTLRGWYKEWTAALEAAKIEDFRFHDLRHTAGTRALKAKGNLRSVQKMLGHKDIATTLRYTASDVDDIRAAMEAVEAQNRHKARKVARKLAKKSAG